VLAEPPLLNAHLHNLQQARLFMLEDLVEKFDQNRWCGCDEVVEK